MSTIPSISVRSPEMPTTHTPKIVWHHDGHANPTKHWPVSNGSVKQWVNQRYQQNRLANQGPWKPNTNPLVKRVQNHLPLAIRPQQTPVYTSELVELYQSNPAIAHKPIYAPLPQDHPEWTMEERLLMRNSAPFHQQFSQVIERAKAHINQWVQSRQKGFVMLDIDETTLDNQAYYQDPASIYYRKPDPDQFHKTTWGDWLQTASAPVIKPTQSLINWLKEKRIPYVFVSGRPKEFLEPTLRNLRQYQLLGPNCLGIFLKPETWEQGTRQYKDTVRQMICRWLKIPIIATIGDQPSDMTADPSSNFRLPNPLYSIQD